MRSATRAASGWSTRSTAPGSSPPGARTSPSTSAWCAMVPWCWARGGAAGLWRALSRRRRRRARDPPGRQRRAPDPGPDGARRGPRGAGVAPLRQRRAACAPGLAPSASPASAISARRRNSCASPRAAPTCIRGSAATMEWDTAAPQAVVEAAGGSVCLFDGSPLRYAKPRLGKTLISSAAARPEATGKLLWSAMIVPIRGGLSEKGCGRDACWLTESLGAGPEGAARAAALLQAGRLGRISAPRRSMAWALMPPIRSRCRAVFEAKGRPVHNPADRAMSPDADAAFALVVRTPAARALAASFWPGPLTMVLPKRPDCIVCAEATAGLPTLAHPGALGTDRAGVAADGGAAGRGALREPLRTHLADHRGRTCWMELAGRIDAVLDCGPCPVGLESTVIDLSGERPRLLRAGGIAAEAIASVLAAAGLPELDHAPRAPPSRSRARLARHAGVALRSPPAAASRSGCGRRRRGAAGIRHRAAGRRADLEPERRAATPARLPAACSPGCACSTRRAYSSACAASRR